MGHGRLCRPTKGRSVRGMALPVARFRFRNGDYGSKNSFREEGLSEAMGAATTSVTRGALCQREAVASSPEEFP